MLVIAHRGESAYYPENSFEAFSKAILHARADGIETDVQFTRDHKVVIIHDLWINRITNGKGLVSDYDWEELKQFYRPNNERLWLLEEVIDLKTRWVIDLKEKSELLVEEVAGIMREKDYLLFMNHNWKPEIETAKILGLKIVLTGIVNAIDYHFLKENGMEEFKGLYGIECDPRHLEFDLDFNVVGLLHQEGLKAGSNWSNHQLESVMKLFSLRDTGIDFFTTARPALAREILREGGLKCRSVESEEERQRV